MRKLARCPGRWPIPLVDPKTAVANPQLGLVQNIGFHSGCILLERLGRNPRLLGKVFRTPRSESRIPVIRTVEGSRAPRYLPALEFLAASNTIIPKHHSGAADIEYGAARAPSRDGGEARNVTPLALPKKDRSAKDSSTEETERVLRILEVATIRKRPLFWRDLFLSSQRRLGVKGAKLVWNKFRSFHVDDLPDLYSIEHFWDTLLPLAFEDDGVRESLIEYVQEIHTHYGRSPPEQANFYCRVIEYALTHEPKNASKYHEQLKFLVPTRSQLKKLVGEIAADSRSLIFQEFCNEILSFKDMYGDIVFMVFEKGGFDAGYRWHLFLISTGHTPDLVHLELLRQLFVQPDSIDTPLRAKKSTSEANPEAPKTISSSAKKDASDLWGILSVLERQILLHNIPKRTISDKTCARFFATTFFSVPSIVNGLRLVNFDAIGPLAIRALMTRTVSNGTCDIKEARDHLAELQKAGIVFRKTIFCNLIRTFIAEDNGQLLHDLVTCDLHSDTFEDPDLQERLLAQYIASNDQSQIVRTLAVLSVTVDARTRETKVRNLLLRAAVTRRDEHAMQQILHKMLDTHTPTTHRSRTFIVKSLVLRDEASKVFATNLLNVINMWKRLATHGTVIDPFEWLGLLRLCREVRSISMVSTYTDLLTWVTKHYRTTDFQVAEGSFQTHATGTPKRKVLGSRFWPTLLPGNEIWSFLRWSMSIAADNGSNAYRLLRGTSSAERVHDLASHPFLEGVRFLRGLRSLGVPVNEYQIKRVCLARLKFIFGHVGSALRVQRRMKRFRMLASIEEYILAIESIWGSNVFLRKGTITDFSIEVLPHKDRRTSWRESDLSPFAPAIEAPSREDDQFLQDYEDHPSSSAEEQQVKFEEMEDGTQEPPPELDRIYGGLQKQAEGSMNEAKTWETPDSDVERETDDTEMREIEHALSQRPFSS